MSSASWLRTRTTSTSFDDPSLADAQTYTYRVVAVDTSGNSSKPSAALNVTTQAIDDTLYDAFGQRIVSTIFTQLNQYRVILEVSPEYQQDPDALSKIYVRANGQSSTSGAGAGSGPLVPLNAFATIATTTAPLVITHQGQFPSATISFNLRPGYFLSDAVVAEET